MLHPQNQKVLSLRYKCATITFLEFVVQDAPVCKISELCHSFKGHFQPSDRISEVSEILDNFRLESCICQLQPCDSSIEIAVSVRYNLTIME